LSELFAGADAVWFRRTVDDDNFGRITPAGDIVTFSGPSISTMGFRVVAPDGHLWFQTTPSVVVRLSPSGALTEYPLPAGTVSVSRQVAIGRDGNLWFSISSQNRGGVGRMTLDGTFTPLALDYDTARVIVRGPGDDLWFVGRRAVEQAWVVARLDTSQAPPTATVETTPSATVSATAFPTATASPTAMATHTARSTATAQQTSTPGTCLGDCNGDGSVTIGDLIRGVNVALQLQPVGTCLAVDADGDSRVTIGELISAVLRAVRGCFNTRSVAGLFS
jgi:streptogramin lyase